MLFILYYPDSDTATLECPHCGLLLPVPDGMTYHGNALDPSPEDVIREHDSNQIEGGIGVCRDRDNWKSTEYEVRNAKSGALLASGTYEVPRAQKIVND